MKLSLSLFTFLQLSHALHIPLERRDAAKGELKRTTQGLSSNDLGEALSKDASNAQKPKKPIPWWKLPNTDNGEMNALTGQQFYPFDDDDVDSESSDNTGITPGSLVCPVNQCQNIGVPSQDSCGPHARCVGSYCQCNLGWKGASNIPMARGWTGLEVLTVWVDTAYSGCTERCNSLSCSEVPQVKGCFDAQGKHDGNKVEDSQELATDGLHLGAIKAPGAEADMDYVAGVADAGSIGPAT